MSKCLAAAAALVVGALALVGNGPGWAQEPEAKVVATVNGTEITVQDVALAAEVLGDDLARIPENVRLNVLVDVLVNQILLADAAREVGVEESAAFKVRQAFYTAQSLRDAYIETVLLDEITDEAVEARYKSEMEELPDEEEVRARHILVDSEAAAKALAGIARGGADFAELAAANSSDPSGEGGDLGYFTADQMVDEFATAAFALKVGEISDPVNSQFGWHVIKLEDRRTKPDPTFESVQDHIKALVLRDLIRERTKALRDAADLQFVSQTGGAAGAAPDPQGEADATPDAVEDAGETPGEGAETPAEGGAAQ